MTKILKILIITVFITSLFAQTEKGIWTKKTHSFVIELQSTKVNKNKKSNLSTKIFSNIRNLYQKVFSDYDGDNCPFYPSCSHFFVLSLKRVSILKASLMFADRFTRDANIFKNSEEYPRKINNRFYDPPKYYDVNYLNVKLKGYLK